MSESNNSVKLGEIIQEFGLEILRTAPNYENVSLRVLDINRPGLPLTGFFEHFDNERLLLIGLTEHTYLSGLAAERRRESRELAFRLADYVNAHGVQLVLLAGDLFDSAAPYRETGEALAEALGRAWGEPPAIGPPPPP